MATPSETLAQSLEALAKLQRADGGVVIRAQDLSRTHRERLLIPLTQWQSAVAGLFYLGESR
jgi:hypothetical protein